MASWHTSWIRLTLLCGSTVRHAWETSAALRERVARHVFIADHLVATLQKRRGLQDGPLVDADVALADLLHDLVLHLGCRYAPLLQDDGVIAHEGFGRLLFRPHHGPGVSDQGRVLQEREEGFQLKESHFLQYHVTVSATRLLHLRQAGRTARLEALSLVAELTAWRERAGRRRAQGSAVAPHEQGGHLVVLWQVGIHHREVTLEYAPEQIPHSHSENPRTGFLKFGPHMPPWLHEVEDRRVLAEHLTHEGRAGSPRRQQQDVDFAVGGGGATGTELDVQDPDPDGPSRSRTQTLISWEEDQQTDFFLFLFLLFLDNNSPHSCVPAARVWFYCSEGKENREGKGSRKGFKERVQGKVRSAGFLPIVRGDERTPSLRGPSWSRPYL
ncbi:hypothetical protein EYF80_053724 [Liparis tanakae]|uniref:Uncharacterized protein n=1 Tax=Liparis tanakae TaxID=230148 RepID=A0A4Z2F4T3_9TELE|nr:hypothetical protein EYF80_053724 [Liparis tanakae]